MKKNIHLVSERIEKNMNEEYGSFCFLIPKMESGFSLPSRACPKPGSISTCGELPSQPAPPAFGNLCTGQGGGRDQGFLGQDRLNEIGGLM